MKQTAILSIMLLFGVLTDVAQSDEARSTAPGHFSRFHRKPLQGRIVSITDQGFVLKSERIVEETITDISLSPEVEIGEEKDKGTKQNLKPGDKVTVYGTKLATGEFVAQQIVVDRQPALPTEK